MMAEKKNPMPRQRPVTRGPGTKGRGPLPLDRARMRGGLVGDAKTSSISGKGKKITLPTLKKKK
jgi:hypothetical protein